MRWCVQENREKTDEALAALAQSGEQWAEEELLNRYKSAVRARARKFFLEGGETDALPEEQRELLHRWATLSTEQKELVLALMRNMR